MADDSNETNRFAPPTAHVADMAASTTAAGELAGRGQRLGAALIDLAVSLVTLGLLAWLTPWNVFSPANTSFGTGSLINIVLGSLVFFALQGYLLVTHGQTIGKKVLGLRIVRTDGSRVDAARMLGLRYGVGIVATAIPFLGRLYGVVDSLLIFRESRQCLHDTIADTIVVRA